MGPNKVVPSTDHNVTVDIQGLYDVICSIRVTIGTDIKGNKSHIDEMQDIIFDDCSIRAMPGVGTKQERETCPSSPKPDICQTTSRTRRLHWTTIVRGAKESGPMRRDEWNPLESPMVSLKYRRWNLKAKQQYLSKFHRTILEVSGVDSITYKCTRLSPAVRNWHQCRRIDATQRGKYCLTNPQEQVHYEQGRSNRSTLLAERKENTSYLCAMRPPKHNTHRVVIQFSTQRICIPCD